MAEKWDDIFSAASGKGDKPPKQDEAKPEQPTGKAAGPWDDLQPPEKEPTVRLNVDISVRLNDALTTKARQLRKPKTEVVRKLLEWALDDLIE
jgi:hypothetical protein